MNNLATPLVSVVIPTYNHARYLGRALQSVLDQTYGNWEVIVIDNHSSDNTDEVLACFADPRISYLKIQNNGVIAASRNAGIRAAKGEWVAFLDSDDWWTADKLQFCIDCINDRVDLIYHDLEIVSDQSRLFRRKTIKSWQVDEPVLIDLMKRGNAIATSSVIVRTALLTQLGGICEDPLMVAAEDYNTWLSIANLTNNFKYLPLRLGFYQIHNNGVSRKDMSLPMFRAQQQYLPLLTESQKLRVEARLKYAKGRHNYLVGKKELAVVDLLYSIRYGNIATKVKSIWMLISIGALVK